MLNRCFDKIAKAYRVFRILVDRYNGTSPDPVFQCAVYRETSCAHVDGFLCDVRSCSMLKNYLKEKK